ncbi:SH protein [Bat paramyxovirus]|nr:SH protein [Bat paramyxovirus]
MDSESALYVNEDFRNNRHNPPDILNDNLNLRITYIRDMMKIRKIIRDIYRYLYISLIVVIIVIFVSVLTSGIILKSSYDTFISKLDKENEIIFQNMANLYKKCKENPMDFDWTSQIFNRLEEMEEKIPKTTWQILIKELDDKSSDLYKMISDNDFSEPHIFLRFEKAEGMEFGSRNTRQPTTQGNKRKFNINDMPKIRKGDEGWIGPTGLPGYGRN